MTIIHFYLLTIEETLKLSIIKLIMPIKMILNLIIMKKNKYDNYSLLSALTIKNIETIQL